ncbi:MAG: hypothetical protein ACE15F_01285 [bacterium]
MKRMGLALLVVVWLASFAAGISAADTYRVGEKWVYQHDGPRPWANPENPVQGDRIATIVTSEGEGAEQLWVMKQQWGEEMEPAEMYFNRKKEVVKIASAERSILYTPPMPMDFSILKAGEEKIFESRIAASGDINPATLRLTVKRLPDATIQVPAGEFTDCRHVQFETRLIFTRNNQETSAFCHQEMWTHPKVNGIVKEIYTFDAVNAGGRMTKGYQAVSELKSYTPPEKK